MLDARYSTNYKFINKCTSIDTFTFCLLADFYHQNLNVSIVIFKEIITKYVDNVFKIDISSAKKRLPFLFTFQNKNFCNKNVFHLFFKRCIQFYFSSAYIFKYMFRLSTSQHVLRKFNES